MGRRERGGEARENEEERERVGRRARETDRGEVRVGEVSEREGGSKRGRREREGGGARE